MRGARPTIFAATAARRRPAAASTHELQAEQHVEVVVQERLPTTVDRPDALIAIPSANALSTFEDQSCRS
jgi:hypothetical protein